MFEKDLLRKLYTEESTSKNIVLEHADKVWLMPECAVKGAMEMYQPTSRGGKCLKKSVIKKHKAPIFARGTSVEQINIELNKEVRKQLEDILGISVFYVATYMGDTSTSQNDKAVLQIYGDDEIYAYVKITMNEENAKRFEKEANAIKNLNDLGVNYVPRLIGTDLDSDVKMLAQLNEKPMGQTVKLDFNNQVLDTVKDIVEKTTKDIESEDSQFCESVEYLKKHLDVFEQDQKAIVEDAIKMVEEEKLTFAFAHGDFTPWNVYYVKDEMRIFDMEYCSDTMPAYIDVFHYLSQTTLLANRYTAQCAMREYERQLDLISEYVDNPKLTFICYLVWIISFYLERTNDIEIIREKIDVWVEMLEYLVKYL